MANWRAIAVLPNIDVAEPVEGGLMALVGHGDPRLRALRRAEPNLNRFLGRFTDAFGVNIKPAVLIQQADAPEWARKIDAIASFRDAVAIATVPYNRALEINYARGHRITFSNWLWLYPWMVDRNDEHLIANTPGMLALHQVTKFRGQPAPEISPMMLSSRDLDEPMLEALLARWLCRYASPRPSWRDSALFRSLNMAQQAAQMPAGMDTTFYDVGRMIALWVSAFEILAHPGDRKSGLSVVYELLDKVEWISRKSAARRYKAYLPRQGASRRTAACRLYGELYQVRNAFLHGNEIAPSRLRLPGDLNLFQVAAPLYRIALTGFLLLRPSNIQLPHISDREAYISAHGRKSKLLDHQRIVEKAILRARGIDLDRDIRDRMARRRAGIMA